MIYCIRHGETDWNRTMRIQGASNIPLNSLGRQQAVAVAERMKDMPIEVLYASDLDRAHDTAQQIALVKGMEVISSETLRERSFGDLEGKTRDEVNEFFGGDRSYWSEGGRFGIESMEDLEERAFQAIQQIAEREPGKRVAIVSHGAFINAFIARITNGENGSGKLRLDNTSICSFTYTDGKWEIVSLNDCEHLYKPVSDPRPGNTLK